MDYAKIIYELKELNEELLHHDTDFAQELAMLIATYETAKGDCCG